MKDTQGWLLNVISMDILHFTTFDIFQNYECTKVQTVEMRKEFCSDLSLVVTSLEYHYSWTQRINHSQVQPLECLLGPWGWPVKYSLQGNGFLTSICNEWTKLLLSVLKKWNRYIVMLWSFNIHATMRSLQKHAIVFKCRWFLPELRYLNLFL